MVFKLLTLRRALAEVSAMTATALTREPGAVVSFSPAAFVISVFRVSTPAELK